MQHIDAAKVAQSLGRRALIDALEDAFRAPHTVPSRHHHELDPGAPGGISPTLLIMPAWDSSAVGIKIVTVFPDNATRGLPAVCASYLMLDGRNGAPIALLDGSELTLRRTAAASALASRHLSSATASRLLMVGTGKLAPHLIESHAIARPIVEVKVWGRSRARASETAALFAGSDLKVEVSDDLEEAVGWADIVSCATLARQPVIKGAWLKPGQHVDLVGAFTRDMCEADDAAIARARVFVDTREGALSEAGEITGAIERGIIGPQHLQGQLADLRGDSFARRQPEDITLFKSVGTALEDLVAATLVLKALGLR